MRYLLLVICLSVFVSCIHTKSVSYVHETKDVLIELKAFSKDRTFSLWDWSPVDNDHIVVHQGRLVPLTKDPKGTYTIVCEKMHWNEKLGKNTMCFYSSPCTLRKKEAVLELYSKTITLKKLKGAIFYN